MTRPNFLIRPAEETDTEEIVNLLRASLGEAVPQTFEFWRWKHRQNPFGPSPVLLAFDEERLVGVRAFLRWRWEHPGYSLSAVRAVDTATHPDYQGKGIFKKLTLELVERCKQEKIDLVFNTPNDNSRPGYLKMGWTAFGRLGVALRPILSRSHSSPSLDTTYVLTPEIVSGFFSTAKVADLRNRIVTPITAEYVIWRYHANPNVRYQCLSGEIGGVQYLAIFRLKDSRLGTELRICDIFTHADMDEGRLKRRLLSLGSECGAAFVSYSGWMKLFSPVWQRVRVGPIVTVRSLASDAARLTREEWRPTIGDMELF